MVGVAEAYRASLGWKAPGDGEVGLRDSYYPGDLGFDPLKLSKSDAAGFSEQVTSELHAGRAAMLAVAALAVQETQTHETVYETLDKLF